LPAFDNIDIGRVFRLLIKAHLIILENVIRLERGL
jgi:hypothetical protein